MPATLRPSRPPILKPTTEEWPWQNSWITRGRSEQALLTLVLLVLIVGGPVWAHPASEEEGSVASTEAELSSLIDQLGSSDYAARQAAEEQLKQGGRAVRSAIEALLKSEDPELRLRATRLQTRFQTLVNEVSLQQFADGADHHPLAWPAVQKILGDSPEARQLFVTLCRSEPALMAALDQPGPAAQRLLGERIRQWHLRITTPAPATHITELADSVLVLAIAAGTPELVLSEEESNSLTMLLYRQESQASFYPAGADPADDDEDEDSSGVPPLAEVPPAIQLRRKLLSAWLSRTDAGTDHQKLLLALNLSCSGGLEVAERALANGPAPTLQYALLALGRFGNTDQLPLVESYLENNTVLARRNTASGERTCELRDVALAVGWLLRKEVPSAHQMAGVILDPRFGVQPSSLGFFSAEERLAALGHYRAWKQAEAAPQEKY